MREVLHPRWAPSLPPWQLFMSSQARAGSAFKGSVCSPWTRMAFHYKCPAPHIRPLVCYRPGYVASLETDLESRSSSKKSKKHLKQLVLKMETQHGLVSKTMTVRFLIYWKINIRVMWVLTVCWWRKGGDNFKILVTKYLTSSLPSTYFVRIDPWNTIHLNVGDRVLLQKVIIDIILDFDYK